MKNQNAKREKPRAMLRITRKEVCTVKMKCSRVALAARSQRRRRSCSSAARTCFFSSGSGGVSRGREGNGAVRVERRGERPWSCFIAAVNRRFAVRPLAVPKMVSGIVCAQWPTWHEDSGGRAGHRIGCRRQTVGRCGYWSAKRRKRGISADVGRVVESTRVL